MPAQQKRNRMEQADQKRRLFVNAFLAEKNATKAAIAAGYSAKTAAVAGSRLLKDVKVQQLLDQANTKVEAHTGITREWVLDALVRNFNRAMEAEPVMDKEGNRTGEYTYNGAVANKALELIGKELGMFEGAGEQRVAGTSLTFNLTVEDRRAFFIALGQALSAHPEAKAAVGALLEYHLAKHANPA